MLDNKTILITGGTGSFGQRFVRYLLANTNAKKIIVYSRDELKQFKMSNELTDPRLRFFLGDIRELPRLQRAFKNVDIVVHAAALKQVPLLEYNPAEAIKTNVYGSQNVIEAAIDQGVQKVLLISTDKAAQPVNLYGATKLCAEKLFTAANSYSPKQTLFSCVRYGNVVASRGSIVETLLQNQDAKKVAITHIEMTRFWITFQQTFELVMNALSIMEGGETFIPKIPSMKIIDLFKALAPEAEVEIIGIRAGEKIHETLITEEEARHTLELSNCYVILPEFHEFARDIYSQYQQLGQPLPADFSLTSKSNTDWLSHEDISSITKNLE